MVLTLEFRRKQATKTSDENKRQKQAMKTIQNMDKIEEYLKKNGEAKTSDISKYIGLSSSRTRVIISEMENIEILGGNNNRTYRLK